MPPICLRCGRPDYSGYYCSSCWASATNINGIRSVFYFDGTVKKLIYEIKYGNLRALSDMMGEIIFNYLNENKICYDVIVPVPLHPNKLKKRGYNQSALIAQSVARKAEKTLISDILIRIKDTPPQVDSKNLSERLENVRGAFQCKNNSLSGMNVLLLDDVCTTGSTLEACAKALKGTGVNSIWAITIAREI